MTDREQQYRNVFNLDAATPLATVGTSILITEGDHVAKYEVVSAPGLDQQLGDVSGKGPPIQQVEHFKIADKDGNRVTLPEDVTLKIPGLIQDLTLRIVDFTVLWNI